MFLFSRDPSLSKKLGRRRRFGSLVTLGGLVLVACSSGESTPNNPVASAGSNAAGTTTAAGGTAGSAASGGANAAGNAGTATASGGTAGSTTGSGGSGGNATALGGAGGSATGGTATAGAAGSGGVSNAPFALTSSAFKEGEQIPLLYKCAQVNPKGQNMSPPLSWGRGPTGTKSYAIVLMHLPTPEHWVLWDIPASITSLAADIEHKAMPAVPAGSKQSLANLDGFMGSGYFGPCPQAANSVQSYQFTLYALDVDTVPGLTATSSPTEAATAVKQHLVAGSQGVSLTGTQVQTP